VAGWAGAAELKPQVGSLALVPKDAVAFMHFPKLRAFEADLKNFQKETGWQFGQGEHPMLDLIGARTGLTAGIDLDGSASIGFLDPKKFHERYTLYVLPVSDWDALLKATQGEEMSPGLYALTGATGPRYVLKRGRYAIVTSSVRTMDALAAGGGESILGVLPSETLQHVAAGSPTVFVNVHAIKLIYEGEILSWFRATSGQVYNSAEAVPYADMLVTYLLGIASFIDQIDTIEATLKFDADGVGVDLALRFADEGGIAKFLAAQKPGGAPIPLPTDRALISAVTMRLDPESRADLLVRATQFFLDEAPRPEPLPETTKKQVREAMVEFAGSLGDRMTFLAAPAKTGLGVECDVTVLDIKDPAQFKRGLDKLVSAWEALADHLNLYMRFQENADAAQIDGVQVTSYTPRFRFGIPARHLEFRERLKGLFGPEGLVYRVAIVGNKAIIGTGSDLGLFTQAIENLKSGKELPMAPQLKHLESHLPPRQHVAMAMSLPMFLSQALLRGGTPAEKLGDVDPGKEYAGFSITAEGTAARLTSYWPSEQIRLAKELLDRAAPDITKAPGSLFEPAESPPKGAAPAPAAPGGATKAPAKAAPGGGAAKPPAKAPAPAPAPAPATSAPAAK
jgi:hypothetical protein